ncbi:N-acetylmuramoyl-L-alanine amidase [Streptomyces sp. H27-D2]|uniref:N-acetylmuramoyl-L-alanine amidase n=1 Tax=Streptomyces sp. H27-D2 TaxID=3046304 RepID=UPI002DBAB3A7|nr:N-acetylmuramoyl-L-alanine amidase [Streptomyces sp. H27-D2]MEC4016303.1 N-acetylmuramoyl-L-alanine amidase [Streptomyces sp. H27-D2]
MEAHNDAPRPPTRRGLLRGGALLGATALGLAAPVAARAADRRRAGAAADPPTHWIPASPSNYTKSSRPSAYPVDFVVIHVTQETFRDTQAIFQNPDKKVSAHYVVASADGCVGQFVREADVAWHAGNWDYNTRSIGIEHEGWVDKPEYFTDALYRQSAALTAAVCDRYGIPKNREHIIGHAEVPKATHTDPGPHWDWPRYIGLVNGG